MPEISPDAKTALLERLAENMQVIYRKAIDADEILGKLHQGGKGKFNHVFTEDAGFVVQSKRFMPYVKELAGQVIELEKVSMQEIEAQLPTVVKKMELLLTTLEQFKKSL